MHLDLESKAKIKNAKEFERERRLTKGRVVLFKRVISVVVFTWKSDHLRVIGPGDSRSLRGILFSAPMLFLGWWSLSGWLHTCYALSHNALGGVDVTESLGPEGLQEKVTEDAAFKSRRFGLCVLLIAGMICAACLLLFGGSG